MQDCKKLRNANKETRYYWTVRCSVVNCTRWANYCQYKTRQQQHEHPAFWEGDGRLGRITTLDTEAHIPVKVTLV